MEDDYSKPKVTVSHALTRHFSTCPDGLWNILYYDTCLDASMNEPT